MSKCLLGSPVRRKGAAGAGPGSDTTALHQLGDSFAATLIFGTNDANDSDWETTGVSRWRLLANGLSLISLTAGQNISFTGTASEVAAGTSRANMGARDSRTGDAGISVMTEDGSQVILGTRFGIRPEAPFSGNPIATIDIDQETASSSHPRLISLSQNNFTGLPDGVGFTQILVGSAAPGRQQEWAGNTNFALQTFATLTAPQLKSSVAGLVIDEVATLKLVPHNFDASVTATNNYAIIAAGNQKVEGFLSVDADVPRTKLHVKGDGLFSLRNAADETALSIATNTLNAVSPTNLASPTVAVETAFRFWRDGTAGNKFNMMCDLQVGTYSSGINAQTEVRMRVNDGGTHIPDTDVMRWRGSGLVTIPGTLEIGTPPTYSESNVTTDRTFNADLIAISELADVVGTLIQDLRAMGLVN